jgi:hypothetical protein
MSLTATMPAVRPYSSSTTRSCSETAQLGEEEGVQRLGLRHDQCVAYDSCGPRSRLVREDQLLSSSNLLAWATPLTRSGFGHRRHHLTGPLLMQFEYAREHQPPHQT